MSEPSHPKPRLRRIALADLLAHRNHPYYLPPRIGKALTQQIASGGLYPPLIVRPHARKAGKFEILDGHQRAMILRTLGASDARCEVWNVSDAQAELYSATLNHLRGRPEGKGRARQIRRLIRRLGQRRVEELLGMTPAGIRQQMLALEPPQTLEGPQRAYLRPVTFHLPPSDAEELDRTLGPFRPAGSKRGERLMAAIRAARDRRGKGR